MVVSWGWRPSNVSRIDCERHGLGREEALIRPMAPFHLESPHAPAGDQPRAIAELTEGLERGDRFQTLLGATGTGKTYTIAHVIANHGRPTLVMSHNKTLAAQLYGELKALFPGNAVEYFISYYDYYQPEAYVPATDTYIEKDASINEDIERLRLRATSSLMERDDAIVVASISCIYGLGSPADYRGLMMHLKVGEERPRKGILKGLVDIQYKRNDYVFERGTFRVRGDTVEVLPAYEDQAVRIGLWGDQIERITRFDPLTGETIAPLERTAIYPASHYVTRRQTIEQVVPRIREELVEQLTKFRSEGRLLEAQRLETRTNFEPRDDARDRYLPRDRELLALHRRAAARGPAGLPVRLLPGRHAGGGGRIPRDRAPDQRHVQRRPLA